ncbi:DUF2000 domain-containing protein [Massilia sp. MB5]|uniref:DUF2000 domain-containing protein n=1 Tax=unclassified Massilia TaxID=2609279 RepID=UPI00067C954C|nr:MULTISPECIES: DUF2000 domain-containing protein [unclassified Massilia]AKU24046.1 hypothetical protein ACZ75_23935 [Massilia sp. NR 4-1]UMR30983.1 DUF2000 domain-containing protein [Massilia sp. MB5]
MAYENTERKFVALVNRKHPLPVLLNALAHASNGLTAKTAGRDKLLDYPNQASGFAAKISEYPFIILEAKNGNQIRNLLPQVMADDSLDYNVFTTSMIGASATQQIEATLAAADEQLDFVVLLMFGERGKVEPLAKKFSLLKAPSAPAEVS